MAAKKSKVANRRAAAPPKASKLAERLAITFTVLSFVYLVVAYWRYG